MTAKTLFITGASSGIGAETARAAADAGWNVALFARRRDELEALVAELGEARALALPGDVTQMADLEHAVREAQGRFGQINAVFANAGRGLDTPGVAEGDPEEWRSMMEINVMGLLWTMKASYRALRESKGHLILTGSAAGKRHIKGSIYGASKWFVHGLAGNMAEEMREWGGRCTVVAPGMVDTPFFDSPKPDKLKPEDVAHAVMHALSAPERASVQEIFLMPTQ
ncbi:putative oxidoreductase [Roseovarius sp. A-2]|uniref:SDR family oxidoreductase n=1 Tax=Roseovarius sp. A-2 TaxID=1570360 RepID=UPI0009B5646C|nr:SDR family oxidoreductase [Roseovarius sp. A-2]GAW33814.1 putative oxidoreductase [Roseovarius sp. A-2]